MFYDPYPLAINNCDADEIKIYQFCFQKKKRFTNLFTVHQCLTILGHPSLPEPSDFGGGMVL